MYMSLTFSKQPTNSTLHTCMWKEECTGQEKMYCPFKKLLFRNRGDSTIPIFRDEIHSFVIPYFEKFAFQITVGFEDFK